jgi:hypothetical protein
VLQVQFMRPHFAPQQIIPDHHVEPVSLHQWIQPALRGPRNLPVHLPNRFRSSFPEARRLKHRVLVSLASSRWFPGTVGDSQPPAGRRKQLQLLGLVRSRRPRPRLPQRALAPAATTPTYPPITTARDGQALRQLALALKGMPGASRHSFGRSGIPLPIASTSGRGINMATHLKSDLTHHQQEARRLFRTDYLG